MDLGDDFSDGTMKWCIVTFDRRDERSSAKVSRYLATSTREAGTPIQVGGSADGVTNATRPLRSWMVARPAKSLNAASVNHDGPIPAVIKNLHYKP
jgi:hypothetical protein